jgi:hypothetical protein
MSELWSHSVLLARLTLAKKTARNRIHARISRVKKSQKAAARTRLHRPRQKLAFWIIPRINAPMSPRKAHARPTVTAWTTSVTSPFRGVHSKSDSWSRAPPDASKNMAAADTDANIFDMIRARRQLRERLRLKRENTSSG